MVALHPEGVDRNLIPWIKSKTTDESPSTRRAWIEIVNGYVVRFHPTSPSTRRAWIEIRKAASTPQT